MCCSPLAVFAYADQSRESLVYVTVAAVAASFVWSATCCFIPRYFDDTRLGKTALWLQIMSITMHPAGWGLLFLGILRADDQYIVPFVMPCVAALVFVIIGTRNLRSILAAVVGNLLELTADFAVFVGGLLGMSDW